MPWALEKIAIYKYRKEFGLTYKEFLEEDFEQFSVNSAIMNAVVEIENDRARAAKRGIH